MCCVGDDVSHELVIMGNVNWWVSPFPNADVRDIRCTSGCLGRSFQQDISWRAVSLPSLAEGIKESTNRLFFFMCLYHILPSSLLSIFDSSVLEIGGKSLSRTRLALHN